MGDGWGKFEERDGEVVEELGVNGVLGFDEAIG